MKKIFVAAVAMSLATPALAQDFFAGKNVTILVASSTGGGLDTYARLVGRHFQKHIPGRPNIVVQNMPGAGGNIVAQNIYNIAPKDGTTLALFQPTFVLEKITDKARKFEPEKFGWIGRVDQSVLVGLVFKHAKAQTIDEVKKTETVLSANAAAGTSATIPWALNRLIGTKFKVILGFPSSAAMGLALERGEADGIGSTSWDYLQTKQDFLDCFASLAMTA